MSLILEPFQEDRYTSLQSDSFSQSARAREFGKLSLSTKQRQKLIKTLPSKTLRTRLRSLWPLKYVVLKDIKAPIYYKYEKDPDECVFENHYLFSIFLKHRRGQELLFPAIEEKVSLMKIDTPLEPKPTNYEVIWVDHVNTSTALICLKKIS